MKRSGFTMIELVIVIVVLGILSSIAISKMAVTRDDALITKGKSQVSAIRSAITLMRSKNMMRGIVNGGNPKKLDALPNDTIVYKGGEKLFDYDSNSSDSTKKILDYPIYAGDENGKWKKLPKVANGKYPYELQLLNVGLWFNYNPSDGSFDCNHAATDATLKKLCKTLTE